MFVRGTQQLSWVGGICGMSGDGEVPSQLFWAAVMVVMVLGSLHSGLGFKQGVWHGYLGTPPYEYRIRNQEGWGLSLFPHESKAHRHTHMTSVLMEPGTSQGFLKAKITLE
jgi:hypothetical protein